MKTIAGLSMLFIFSLGACSKPQPMGKGKEQIIRNYFITIIHDLQHKYVKDSKGQLDYECFSEKDLEKFIESEVLEDINNECSKNDVFKSYVHLFRMQAIAMQYRIVMSCWNAYQYTWSDLGNISELGQTVAGQKAQRLIANEVVAVILKLKRENVFY